MSFLTVNGVRFNVQRLGRGDHTVVFLHGLVLDNLSSWYFTVANAMAQRADTLLYDLRGHGLSGMPKSGYCVEDSVADLAGILDAAHVRRPVYLVGNSYGGQVAIAFTLAYPEHTAGLVFLEAHFAVEGWGERMAAKLEFAGMEMNADYVRNWLNHAPQRHHERRFRKAEDLMSKTSLIEDLRGQVPFSESALRSIHQPALALYGEHSDVLDRGRDLERLLPHCELRVLREGSHALLISDTAWVREQVLGWFAQQWAAPVSAEIST